MQVLHHVAGMNDVAFSPDGRLLATGGTEDSACVWALFGDYQLEQ
jgi:WD40 repeat protein